MSNIIYIKTLTDDGLIHFKKNISKITPLIKENKTNDWIKDEFSHVIPLYNTKNIKIEDFYLKLNPGSKDKDLDFENSVKIYEHLKCLPNFILSDVRFWLWLHMDKFYEFTVTTMEVKDVSTIRDHWLHEPGVRRGLMFGVLSRMFYRVALTVDESKSDKYYLTRWIIENPIRFREFSWRSYSSSKNLIRGIIRGEKRAMEETKKEDKAAYYTELGKFISELGSVHLLDVMSEDDVAEIVYKKMLEIVSSEEN